MGVNCVAADMYEMLMIQNAQMHQMIMQQLMLSTITRPPAPAAAAAANNDDTLISVDIKDLIDVSINIVLHYSELLMTFAERKTLCLYLRLCPSVRPSVCLYDFSKSYERTSLNAFGETIME